MRERELRRLPIVGRDDRLVGIVTLDDLLRFLGRELYNPSEGIRHEMQVKESAAVICVATHQQEGVRWQRV
jgi:CBS domain-containing protein